MKLNKIAPLIVLLGSFASAHALTPVQLSYTADDLFLGFRASGGTGATQCYLVDIGQASIYRDATGNVSPSLGNIASDLTTLFGANWYSRSDVFWSVTGTPGASAVGSDGVKLLYATAVQVGGASTAWLGGSTTAQGTAMGKMISMSQQYVATLAAVPNYSTSNSLVGLIQNNTDPNSYSQYATGPSGISFGFFNPTVEGTVSSVLDLYRIPTGIYNQEAPSVGSFSLNSSGVLTFAKPVPEPSSLGLFGAASALLVAWTRKRSRKQTA